MDDDPPEQKSQSLSNPKTLVFSFDSEQKQTDFIFELMSFKMDKAHFSLSIQKKNTCSMTLFCMDEQSRMELENRIKIIIDNINHEKNKWRFW